MSQHEFELILCTITDLLRVSDTSKTIVPAMTVKFRPHEYVMSSPFSALP